MNNDTALILLLADLQRQIQALKAENARLTEELTRRAADGDPDCC